MRTKFLSLILIHIVLSLSLSAQAAVTQPPPAQGVDLPVVSEVSSAVTVDAVLLPYSVAKRAFGKETAQKYAAVSLTVSNRDPKQSLIIHSVFLDYSHWLFSGTFSKLGTVDTVKTASWQQQNTQSEVASAEVRIVRNQLQDAQLWSLRNWVIRSAIAVGTVSAGLSFANSSTYFASSVSAYSADFVPALSVLWPDNTQAQSDLISDIGFRTNHVVPAQSADIVIAFFPIDRFLTPSLKKIYFQAPAAFFNPSEMLLDRKYRGNLLSLLELAGVVTGSDDSANASSISGAVLHYEQAAAIANPDPVAAEVKPVNPCAVAVPQPPLLPGDCMIVNL
jgi:hypothetical protein